LKEKDILKFIPKTADYNYYINEKEKNEEFGIKNMGTVFELKFKINDIHPTFGFFYLLKGSSTLPHFNSKSNQLQGKQISLGINFEYNNTYSLFKIYRYFYPAETVKNICIKTFGIDSIYKPKLIEYAENENYSKINVLIEPDCNFLSEQKIFSIKEQKIIQYLNQKYNLVNIQYGIYDEKHIKSIYFHSQEIKTPNNTIGVFVDTLNNILNYGKHK
jgi:hypothetical protein